jgi:hypothetical protein
MQGDLREVYLRTCEHFKSAKKGQFRPEFRGVSPTNFAGLQAFRHGLVTELVDRGASIPVLQQ